MAIDKSFDPASKMPMDSQTANQASEGQMAMSTAPGAEAHFQAANIESPEPEKKKRYYSPNDVMKKKGCIGCGGMVLTLVLLAALGVMLVAWL